MLRQIKYFQSVVRNNSFSEAALECHISQSAISQQIQALEREIGFVLLERKNRRFELTQAGEYFYKKSLILVADYERMCSEASRIAREDEAVLRVGYLRSYSGPQFRCALERFADKYPDILVEVSYGNHEELYDLLRTGRVDMALNDQRRAFSDEYVNLVLTTCISSIEISAKSPIAQLPSVTPGDLKNTPCILVSSQAQKEIEWEYYHNIVGFHGEYLYAENLEAARLLVIGQKGFMPVDGPLTVSDGFAQGIGQAGGSALKYTMGGGTSKSLGPSIRRVPLYRGDAPMTRNYCIFWRKDNSCFYVEEFADILKSQYQ